MRRVPIRIKLLGALSVPLVLLVTMSYVQMRSATSEVDRVRDQAELATAISGPQGVLTRIQEERNWTVAELIGAQDQVELAVTGYEATRRNTDTAIRDFEAELERRSDDVAAAYRPALESTEGLGQLRQAVSEDNGPRSLENQAFGNEVFNGYATVIETFLGAGSTLLDDIGHSELRVGAELVDLSSRQVELIAQLARNLLLPGRDSDDHRELGELVREYSQNSTQIRNLDAGPYEDLVINDFPDIVADDLTSVANQTIQTGEVDTQTVFNALQVAHEDSFNFFTEQASGLLRQEADDLIAGAVLIQRMYALIALAVVAASIVIGWVASYSITRPLRAVTAQATDMAEIELPSAVQEVLEQPLGEDVVEPRLQPIDIDSRDEVREVAGALTAVQDSALGLAVEQAVLRRNIADSFIHLGERNQKLLGRQLAFITELERDQAEPDALGNLFRLDHLATRMRRYAESLLVLAGASPPRRSATPARVVDVIRAALGEVEDYPRVVVTEVEPIAVTGTSSTDVSHLLAELIENALSFSPPDEPVEVKGYWESSDYTLLVIDKGVGMPPEEIMRANLRLAGGESFTVSPSKYLGHYVAGNLAVRHAIVIRLRATPNRGVTAAVHIPSSLLVPESPRDLPQASRIGTTVQSQAAMTVPPALPAPTAPATTAAAATTPANIANTINPADPSSPWQGLGDLFTAEPEPPGALPDRPEPLRVAHGPGHGADEVRSFLSNFADGVQRGLGEVHRHRDQG